MKKIWALLPALFCAAAIWLNADALALEAEELIPVGDAIGIEIKMDGVLVAETGPLETASGKVSPARDAGICPGDIIISVNDRKVTTAAEFLTEAAKFDGSPVSLAVKRKGQEIAFSLKPAHTIDGSWQLGLWLRDGVCGMGTVTFYDPKSGVYGALGHGINDLKTGELLPIGSGSILDSEVTEIVQGKAGCPGELRGAIDKAHVLGSIESNSICGIFGHASAAEFSAGSPLPVATPEELVLGDASILCTVSGETKEYAVEICRVYRASEELRSMLLCVRDPELLSLTGGIVQGMSGSPIIQNGKIVGAVTHVLVNDPTRGYGIFIEKMLDAAE